MELNTFPAHHYYSPDDDEENYQFKIEMELNTFSVEGVFSYRDGTIQVEFDGIIEFEDSLLKKMECDSSNGVSLILVHCTNLWTNEPLKKTYATFKYALLRHISEKMENKYQETNIEFDPSLDIFGYRSHHFRHTNNKCLSIVNELDPISTVFGLDLLKLDHRFKYRSDDHDILIRHAHIFSIKYSTERNLDEVLLSIEQLNHLINLLTSTKNEVSHIQLIENNYKTTLLKNKTKTRKTGTQHSLLDIYQHEDEWIKVCKTWPTVYNKHKDFIIRMEDLIEDNNPYLKTALYPLIFEGISQKIEFSPDASLTEHDLNEIESLDTSTSEPNKRVTLKKEIMRITDNKLSDNELDQVASITWPKSNKAYVNSIKDNSFLYKSIEKTKLKSILTTITLERNSFAHSGLLNNSVLKMNRTEAIVASSFMEMLIISSLLKECNLNSLEREHFIQDLKCKTIFRIWSKIQQTSDNN